MRKTLYALIVPILLAHTASAWNSVGHQTVAELAWRQLDKGERRAASALLRQHPHYQSMLIADAPAGVDTNEWAFLNAAVWLDRVRPAKAGQPHKPRSVTQYDVYPHAVGYPFLRSGDTNRALLEKFFIAKPDAEMVLSNSLATLKNSTASAEARAVSLCVVLHLCGDLHQPFHAANLVTKDKPDGNGLGGSFLVLDQGGNQVNLHTYWDQLPGSDFSYRAVVALADELATAPELKPAALNEYQEHKTIASWVQESYRAAVSFGYAEERVQYVDAADVKSGRIAASAIPALKADYISGAQTIMHRRLALAAQRLADQLKQAW